MAKLTAYFRSVHLMVISRKMADRLAQRIRHMRQLDSAILLGVTGSDVSAFLPRRVDVTLGELRLVLAGRRISA